METSQFPFVFPEYRLGLADVDLFIRGHKTRPLSLRIGVAHKIPDKELTYSKGGDMVDLERLFILKYDDSTVDDDIDDADEDYLF